ncbi:MAG: EAL domain-containing protein [Burkholderiales bacterium]|nr:EAL domain-containing protein [Burkholderiales bacterium]
MRLMLLMDDYNLSAKVYWWTTTMLGATVLVLACVAVAALPPASVGQIVIGVAMAGVAGAFPYTVPRAKITVAGGEIFIFLVLLMNGPAGAALAAAAEGAVATYRSSSRWTSRLASPAIAALAMYACGALFELALEAITRRFGTPSFATMIALLFPAGLAYFASQILLMSSLITLKQRKPLQPLRVLRAYSWMALVNLGCAAVAAILYVGYHSLGIGVFLAALPIIGVVVLTHRLYLRHIEDTELAQQQRIAAAEKEAADAARHLAELQKSESRFQSAFSHAAIGMALVTHDRRVLQANPALCEILGRPAADIAATDFGEFVHRDDHAALAEELERLLSGKTSTCALELRCTRPDRGVVTVALNASVFSSDDAAPCLIFQVQDITARRIAEARLQHIAHHDDLTNLPNRAYFFDQLAGAIRAARKDPRFHFAVLFLDCDRFKTINDSLGHRAGDELLVVLGKRIAAQLRPSDVIARLGGDEFAILARHMREDDAVALATRLQGVVGQPVHIRGAELSTSVSVGIAMGGPQYGSPEDVMRDADIAMYRAKAQGRAQYAMFDTALHAEVSSQLWLESALRRAIEHEQLYLAYQPIFDLRTRQITAVEALCRWAHPERGAVPPDRFIRVAEESGLIVPLGDWALETACRQLAAWQRSVPTSSRLQVHVNVSGAQLLQHDFPERVLAIVARSGVRPEQLALEVTESMLIDGLSVALPNLRDLRDGGLSISIDDFGTGYSSFSSLSELPIGEIKIDRSFVTRMARGREGEEVVRAIVAMGRAMGKRIVAEGVETELQCRKLLDLGCDGGQGYLFARPLAPWDVETILKQARPHAVAL